MCIVSRWLLEMTHWSKRSAFSVFLSSLFQLSFLSLVGLKSLSGGFTSVGCHWAGARHVSCNHNYCVITQRDKGINRTASFFHIQSKSLDTLRDAAVEIWCVCQMLAWHHWPSQVRHGKYEKHYHSNMHRQQQHLTPCCSRPEVDQSDYNSRFEELGSFQPPILFWQQQV